MLILTAAVANLSFWITHRWRLAKKPQPSSETRTPVFAQACAQAWLEKDLRQAQGAHVVSTIQTLGM